MPNSCSTCGIPASLVCSRCKKTHYCGTDHQKGDWTEHKKLCRKPTKKVILLTNASGNTGYSPLPNLACQALTLPEPTSFVKCKSMSTDEIQKWVVQQGYTEYKGSLTDAIGLNLSVYAQRYKWSDEHQGKNNVMATHLVCALDSGLAPHTILGPALVVRRDREGNVIDLEKDELVRLTFFINDCMQDWDSEIDVGRLATVVRAVFPYYNMNKGDTFRGDGFRAENRVCTWNGSQLKLKPADMQFAATYVNTHSLYL